MAQRQQQSLHELVRGTRIGENIKFRAATSTIDFESRVRVTTIDEPATVEGRQPTVVGFTVATSGRWEALSIDPIVGTEDCWVRLRRLA
jgi:hypothetical protein